MLGRIDGQWEYDISRHHNKMTKRAVKFERIAARPRNLIRDIDRYTHRDMSSVYITHTKSARALLGIIEITGE